MSRFGPSRGWAYMYYMYLCAGFTGCYPTRADPSRAKPSRAWPLLAWPIRSGPAGQAHTRPISFWKRHHCRCHENLHVGLSDGAGPRNNYLWNLSYKFAWVQKRIGDRLPCPAQLDPAGPAQPIPTRARPGPSRQGLTDSARLGPSCPAQPDLARLSPALPARPCPTRSSPAQLDPARPGCQSPWIPFCTHANL